MRTPLSDESVFRLAWVAQGPLRATTPFQSVAVSFWLLERGHNFTEVGAAVAIPVLCAFLGVLLGGWIADRNNPLRFLSWRNVILLSLTLVLLAVSQLNNNAEVAVVVASSFYAFANGSGGPPERTLVPRLLERKRYAYGNSIFSAVNNSAMIVGPLLGGIFYTIGGLPLCIFLNALALVFASLLIFGLKSQASQKKQELEAPVKEGFISSILAAWKFVVSSRWLLLLLGLDAVVDVITAGQFQTGFRALSAPIGGSAVYGVILSSYGLGAISGARIAGKSKFQGTRAFTIVMAANVLQAPIVACLPLLDIAPLIIAMLPIGLLNGCGNVIYMTFIFSNIPERLAGRVSAFTMAASLSLQPLGIFLFGILTDIYGVAMMFLASGVMLAAVSIFGLLVWKVFQMGPRVEAASFQTGP